MPTADFTVRQSQWRILLSALAGGGLRHVLPVGASARPEMSINFSGGHFQQFDWAEVYICKKIGFARGFREQGMVATDRGVRRSVWQRLVCEAFDANNPNPKSGHFPIVN
jgi:hypothetical protein